MKKNYLKPQTNSVNMEIENYILDASNDAPIVDTPSGNGKDAGSSRGEWGNVWK